jgi:DNA-binding Lrp family transcriptional regulator
MPSKSPKEIEAELDRLLRPCGLSAQGLWRVMRYEIETNSNRGELRVNAAPASVEQIAVMAGRSPEKVLPTLRKLVSAGVLAQTSAGLYFSPQLARLDAFRDRQSDRQRRRRKGVTSHPEGVTSHPKGRDIDPLSHPCHAGSPSPPPPDGSSLPNPLSSFPLSRSPSGVVVDAGGIESETSSQQQARREGEARRDAVNWITAEAPSFLRSGPAAFTRLILRVGKDEAIRQVKAALADPDVGNPFAYVEAVMDRQKAQRQTTPANGNGSAAPHQVIDFEAERRKQAAQRAVDMARKRRTS